MEKQKLLVALDEHSISTELVKYLGKIISGKKDLEVCLLYMLAPLPPELREERGDNRILAVPSGKERRPGNAISILTRAGVPPNSIRRIARQLVNHEDLTDDILKLAEENACQTIVVGRSSFPWFKETFHRHLADSLVRKATGITIWVVEQPSARL